LLYKQNLNTINFNSEDSLCMEKTFLKYILILIFILINVFVFGQKSYIESSSGVITPMLPLIIVTDNNKPYMNYRLTYGKIFQNDATSYNISVSMYNWKPGIDIVLCPFIKTAFGRDKLFNLYFGPFGSFLIIDKYNTSTTKFNLFYWGLNLGIGIKFQISKQFYILLDFRESIAFSPYSSEVQTAQAGTIVTGYKSYKFNFGNPSIGIGYIFSERKIDIKK